LKKTNSGEDQLPKKVNDQKTPITQPITQQNPFQKERPKLKKRPSQYRLEGVNDSSKPTLGRRKSVKNLDSDLKLYQETAASNGELQSASPVKIVKAVASEVWSY